MSNSNTNVGNNITVPLWNTLKRSQTRLSEPKKFCPTPSRAFLPSWSPKVSKNRLNSGIKIILQVIMCIDCSMIARQDTCFTSRRCINLHIHDILV
jgi:hypothetical protein